MRTTRTFLMICSTALVLPAALLAAQQPGYYPQQPAYQQEQQGYAALDQVDPPSRVARVSQLVGDVSVQPASVNDFSAAELNLPMTTGDRIYSGPGSMAEIQTGQLAVRTGQNADMTVTAMTDTLAQFGLAQGSAHLRSYAVSPNATVEMDTPNVAVSVLEAGDIRVDVDPNTDATIVTVLSGQVEVDGNGVQQVLNGGERARFAGSDPVSAQWLNRPGVDQLDRFSRDRDALYESTYGSDAAYVNPGTIGAEDLNGNGDWSNDPDYGAVWYPRGVAYDWQPYRNGHWTWIAPWGWTWVEAEPWGFAPFHYGRWNRFGNRWGWIPGPVVVRPIYSPALVAFVGGGVGVSAWFPLGPREVYTPWYHASPLYVNRVNVSNIYSRDTVQVRNIYNQRSTNVYVNVNVGGRGYVNRGLATVAMPQDSFARGRRADQNQARVNPQALAGAPVIPHPMVTPERSMIQQGPAHAMPQHIGRPELASHTDAPVQPGSGARPGGGGFGNGRPGEPNTFGNGRNGNGQPNGFGNGNGRPGEPANGNGQSAPVSRQPQQPTQPVQTTTPAQPQRPGQGSDPVRNGQGTPMRPVGPAFPNQPQGGQNGQPQRPAQGEAPAQAPLGVPVRPVGPSFPNQQQSGEGTPNRAVGPTYPTPGRTAQSVTAPTQSQPTTPPQPVQQPRPQQPPAAPVQQPQPSRPQQTEQPRPVQQPQQPQQQEQPQRPLFNRAVPPEPRPSFEQQRQAIQQTDPGRPLSPQQMNNVRQNQPAGQPEQREQAHPNPQGQPQRPPVTLPQGAQPKNDPKH
jgi:hypothetical protein